MKPENLLLGAPGSEGAKRLFLVDVGLAVPWRTPEGHAKYQQVPNEFRYRSRRTAAPGTAGSLGRPSQTWNMIALLHQRGTNNAVMFLEEPSAGSHATDIFTACRISAANLSTFTAGDVSYHMLPP